MIRKYVSVGIHVPSAAVAPLGSGEAYAEFFRQVEALGLDGVWTEDRLFHSANLLDSMVLLAWAAAPTAGPAAPRARACHPARRPRWYGSLKTRTSEWKGTWVMAFIHVLVPTDFSAVAEHALHYAIEEATVHGAKMTLLHVMPSHTHAKVYYVSGAPDVRMGYDPALGGPLPGPRPQIPTTVRYEHHEEVRTRLHDLIPPALAEACDVAVAQGDPAEAIIHMMHEHHADLIVMGTHGRTGLQHALLGSVVEKVVRLAPCPVLTVRDRKA